MPPSIDFSIENKFSEPLKKENKKKENFIEKIPTENFTPVPNEAKNQEPKKNKNIKRKTNKKINLRIPLIHKVMREIHSLISSKEIIYLNRFILF